MYKARPDEGVDGQASNIGMLSNEKIIVQVKHTSNKSETLKHGTRKSVFEKEKRKVKKLVKKNKLETYVIFTNYQLPAGQAQQFEKCFTEAGAKKVEVFGYETLCNLLNGSLILEAKLFTCYPVINPASIVTININNKCTILATNEYGASPSKRPKLDIEATVLYLEKFFKTKLKYNFLETPHKFIIAKLSNRKLENSNQNYILI